jgi:hypothetical protein
MHAVNAYSEDACPPENDDERNADEQLVPAGVIGRACRGDRPITAARDACRPLFVLGGHRHRIVKTPALTGVGEVDNVADTRRHWGIAYTEYA